MNTWVIIGLVVLYVVSIGIVYETNPFDMSPFDDTPRALIAGFWPVILAVGSASVVVVGVFWLPYKLGEYLGVVIIKKCDQLAHWNADRKEQRRINEYKRILKQKDK